MKTLQTSGALIATAVISVLVAACKAPTTASTFGSVVVSTSAQNVKSSDTAPASAVVPQKQIDAGAASAVAGLAAYQTALEDIYQRVNPSVVHINVSSASAQGNGSGSGFIWDAQGHIVTNNHVVSGMDKISVVFSDGSSAVAKVVGTDPDSDLAVIQVAKPNRSFAPVTLADSTRARVGQFAIAIGSPFGERGTMTTGIISALGRTFAETAAAPGRAPGYSLPDMIQTDAAINPGNSGGVLVDAAGQVLGVTAAIESPVRASSGVGFVIPSVIVGKVVPSLIANGSYEHTWLGISGATLNSEDAVANGLESDQRGVIVATVTKGGPADSAGLVGATRSTGGNAGANHGGGDIITAIDGRPVTQFEDVMTYLARNTVVGQSITLDVLRNGAPQQATLTLSARPKTAG